jgi:hypothetical protein
MQHAFQGELAVLFDRYGSDKGSAEPDNPVGKPYPWQPHTYGNIYEMIFKPIRHTVKYVYECGLGTSSPDYAANMGSSGKPGASLRAWRDFFPQAHILGADIDRSSLFSEERISTAYVDQTSGESIKQMWACFGLNDKVDIMIDDGLHNYQGGSTLFSNSFEHLRDGGIYIIEDVAPNLLADYDTFFLGLGLSYQVIATPRHNQMDDNIFLLVVK